MPRGRPPKRRIFNNLRPPQQRQQENELPQPLQEITNVRDELSENNPINAIYENQASTSRPLPLPEVTNARKQVPQNNTNNVIHENQASTSRPVRSAKNDCMNRLNEVLRELNDYQSQELREQIREINNKRRILAESTEERERRQENDRLRASKRRAEESPEQRAQRLLIIRLRASQRRAEENEERRQQRLEEQRRRNERRQRALLLNPLRTYKLAVTSDVSNHTLGNFNVACLHCGALHFPEERVSNRTHRNSFGDCCLHGRIELHPPKFPNELVRLFLHCHPLTDEFHKRIRNLNACFAMASFTVDDNRTINNRGIYTFIAAGNVYHKINVAAHPTQNSQGEFERPRYGQMYFLDNEDAVNERVNIPLNNGISVPLMNLLEGIIRSQNPFVQGFMMMREVEEEVNQRAAEERTEPPYVKLLFALPEGADHRRYNIPFQNDVCAVVTLNADQSFPDNELVIRQRGKSIVTMRNIDQRVEPFTYPLFYPKGTFGYSIDLPLRTPYASRRHLTRLELAQYRIAFRPQFAQFLPLENPVRSPDLRLLNFNALHYGGKLFQQYLVDTAIRVIKDRIDWIKANQKKILADNYASVTNFINQLAEQKNATVGEKLILPSSFPGSTRYYAEHFEDAMALVRRLGSPDYFITMTCNPDWSEIKEAARIQFHDQSLLNQPGQDRPDLVARVAKKKFHELIDDLDKKQIFGKVAAYVYTIEFQKRGLPHMHLLLIMSSQDKIYNVEELDDLISAEIPDDDPILRDLMIKWMIHNPVSYTHLDVYKRQRTMCPAHSNRF